uniref:Uncharacterized protein n=1 Tax=Tetradesmus obliquus TaxID=3088 RepID=A0A383WP47_TETOB|eukprot:jgi/Sobl393_1/4610/SZX79237.1
MVIHERPLLQLTHLQRLDVFNLNVLSFMRSGSFAVIARCLTQLTCLEGDTVTIYDDDAPHIISGLATLLLKKLGVYSFGPQQPGAAAGVTGPAAVGALFGQLTGLTSLTLVLGSYAWRDVTASLARLTDLQDLMLHVDDNDKQNWAPIGNVADCEGFVDTIVGLEKLRYLIACDPWFGSGHGEGDGSHPIMRLQAATQLVYLDIFWMQPKPSITRADSDTLQKSMPEVQLGKGVSEGDGFKGSG